MDDVKLVAANVTKSVGLKLNLDKCKSSIEDSIIFLGTPIPKDGEQVNTVADHLLQRAELYEKVMQWNPNVYNAKMYTMLRQVVLARLNFAPSVDYFPFTEDENGNSAMDTQSDEIVRNKAKNDKIDDVLVHMVQNILPLGNSGMDEGQLKEFLAAPHDAGGLEMMLPGLTFQHQLDFANDKWKDLSANITDNRYESVKKRYFNATQPTRDAQMTSGQRPAYLVDPKQSQLSMGRLLAFTDNIHDEELQVIADLCTGKREQNMSGQCALCGNPLSSQHLLSCPRCQGATLAMHNSMVYNLLNSMIAKRRSKFTPTKFGKRPHDHFSDGFFYGSDGRLFHIDVTIVGREEDMAKRFNEKVAAFQKSGNNDNFIPVVVSYTGKVFPQSLELLHKAAPEITQSLLSRILLAPLAKGIVTAQKLLSEAAGRKLVEKEPPKPVKSKVRQPKATQSGGGGGHDRPPDPTSNGGSKARKANSSVSNPNCSIENTSSDKSPAPALSPIVPANVEKQHKSPSQNSRSDSLSNPNGSQPKSPVSKSSNKQTQQQCVITIDDLPNPYTEPA